MATSVQVRQISRSLSVGSDSSGSSNGAPGRGLKSAVVQAARRDTRSPSSSLSRTPSPLPHTTFPNLPLSWNSPSRNLDRDGSEEGEVREEEEEEEEEPPPKKKKEELNTMRKKEPDPLFTRTGGAYIPPARLRLMQAQIQDKSSVAYQRLAWEALKKSINGLVNKVNVSNIGHIVQELFQENIVRGRGLLIRSVIQAQTASPTFTHVYAALVAIINTKFPNIGELLAKRLIIQFRRSFHRNDKMVCVTAAKFLAHLVNQLVLHEIVALELLTLLLENPTDDSVEVAISFLKECGMKLTEISSRGVDAVFETLRSVLHSNKVAPRVQYMIEVMFAVRKDKFSSHPAVIEQLDLVDEEDQITHLLSLGDEYESEEILNVFQPDDDYLANEEKYKIIKSDILGERSSGSEESSGEESGEEEESEEEEEEEEEGAAKMDITDKTESKALSLRRTIYLTIMSSVSYEECAHKLLSRKEEGQESEIAVMLVECCSQERSYLKFYGLLGQRFCLLNKVWVEVFDNLFQEQYATVHRLETNKLRNVAKFFGQLFYSDALPWTGMSCIHLNEEETNSSSRIFVKILFQELAEFMGIPRINERLRDPLLSEAFEGLLPRDNPKNTRFAINFFTSIGLGGLTDDLREHLKDVQKQIMAQKQEVSSSDTDSDANSSESESSENSTSDSEDSSESSSEDTDVERQRQRRHKQRHKQRQTPSPSESSSEDTSGRERRKRGKPKRHKERESVRSDRKGYEEDKRSKRKRDPRERDDQEVSYKERERDDRSRRESHKRDGARRDENERDRKRGERDGGRREESGQEKRRKEKERDRRTEESERDRGRKRREREKGRREESESDRERDNHDKDRDRERRRKEKGKHRDRDRGRREHHQKDRQRREEKEDPRSKRIHRD